MVHGNVTFKNLTYDKRCIYEENMSTETAKGYMLLFIDFVQIFFIFNLFQRNFEGVIPLQKIQVQKSPKLIIVGGGGVNPFLTSPKVKKSPKFKKVPTPLGPQGWGVISTLDQVQSFPAFSIGKLPLPVVFLGCYSVQLDFDLEEWVFCTEIQFQTMPATGKKVCGGGLSIVQCSAQLKLNNKLIWQFTE